MKAHFLKNFVGSNIFVFGSEIEDEDPTELVFFKKPKDTREYLEQISLHNYANLKLVHGTLSSAVSIPTHLSDDLIGYILLPYANSVGDTFIIETDDLVMLEEVVNALVTPHRIEGMPPGYPTESEIVDALFDVDEQRIEDIFILYGYEVPVGLTFSIKNVSIPTIKLGRNTFKEIAKYQA